jgi:hypothetical protein
MKSDGGMVRNLRSPPASLALFEKSPEWFFLWNLGLIYIGSTIEVWFKWTTFQQNMPLTS